MTFGFDFHPEVEAEFDADVDWPDWDWEPTVRSKGVATFPYRVVYFAHGETITIVAVAHAKRRPGYWKGRLAAH